MSLTSLANMPKYIVDAVLRSAIVFPTGSVLDVQPLQCFGSGSSSEYVIPRSHPMYARLEERPSDVIVSRLIVIYTSSKNG